MSELSFKIRIGAEDDTRSAVQSATSGFRTFFQSISKPITAPLKALQGGLGFLRDLSLVGGAVVSGIQAVTSGIDQLIERGSAMSVTRKSFESLTRTLPGQADTLAKSFVDASNGTLTYRRAMELANRATASGINITRDLPTILDFASKKAISTGTSFDLASEQLITGLARQSAAWLDNFGILNDGMDGVKRTFDRVEGKGAFDSLTPAAQKAEFIRQAMNDIRAQQSKIGLSGREAAFQYAKLKNHITDAVDGLTEAIAASESFREAMEGVNEIIVGIKDHFSADGSFADLLFGKGQSDGILGIVAAVFEDIGSLAAEGFRKAFKSTIDNITGILRSLVPSADTVAPGVPTSQPTSQPASQSSTDGWTLWLLNVKRWWSLWKSGAAGLGDGGPGGAGGVGGQGGTGGGGFSGSSGSRAFSATRKAIDQFKSDFQRKDRDASGKVIPPWLLDRVKDAPLTEKGETDRQLQRNLIDREIRKREAEAARDARKMAAQQVREARKAGYDVDREIIEKEIREKLIRERTDDLRAQRRRIDEEINRTWEWWHRRGRINPNDPQAGAGAGGGAQGQGAAGNVATVKSPSMEAKMDSLIARVDAVGAALGVADARIAAVGGRRA